MPAPSGAKRIAANNVRPRAIPYPTAFLIEFQRGQIVAKMRGVGLHGEWRIALVADAEARKPISSASQRRRMPLRGCTGSGL